MPGGQQRGGGVLIAVRGDISSNLIPLSSIGTIEQLCVEIKFSFSKSIFLIVSYIPPENPNDIYQKHIDNVKYVMELSSNNQVIVLGDFNLPNLTWFLEDKTLLPFNIVSDNDESITSFFLSHDFYQINGFKNYIGRVLDLFFISNDIRSTCDLCLSPISRNTVHHKAVVISFEFYTFEKESDSITRAYNFAKGNYAALNNFFTSVDWSFIFDDNDPDRIYNFISDKINFAISLMIPFRKPTLGHKPPWFNRRLVNLKNVKNKAFKKYKKSKNDADLKYFQQIRREFDFLHNFLYRQYIFNIENRLTSDSSAFWQFINTKRRNTGYPTSMVYDNVVSMNSLDSCNLFASFFQSTFSDHNYFMNRTVEPILDGLDINISENDIISSISSLKNSAACIFDDTIPPMFFKYCVTSLVRPIQILFNACLKEGKFLDDWKNCCVVPIFKSGDKTRVINYRPIVKQCALAKIFDRILKEKIYDHISDRISNFQHGFIPGRSTCTNLAVLTNRIIAAMENRMQLDVIYTDFSKAFDSVCHEILLQKLQIFGISGNLLLFFKSFLTNRKLMVKMGSSYSSNIITAFSGIPQGTHLGPLLFLIFINDLPNCLKFCSPLMFADDLKLFADVSNISHSDLVQRDLRALGEWCMLNKLVLNTSKCCTISYTHCRNPVVYNYSIGDVILNRVVEVKDLGVVFDAKLLFVNHIDFITSKAYSMLGFIRRNSNDFRDPLTLKSLYVSFVRSQLEYCSLIWNPYAVVHSDRIERIQNLFTKYAFRKLNWADDLPLYGARRKFLGLQSLRDRRSSFSIVFVYNILNSEIKCKELSDLVRLYIPPRDLRHDRLFYEDFHRTEYGQNEPITRCLKLCNSFSPLLDFKLNKNKFKLNLFKIFN